MHILHVKDKKMWDCHIKTFVVTPIPHPQKKLNKKKYKHFSLKHNFNAAFIHIQYLSSSPELRAQVNICDHFLSVARLSVVRPFVCSSV